MEHAMEQLDAWIETPFSTASEASENFVRASVRKVTEFYSKALFQTGSYRDLGALSEPAGGLEALDNSKLMFLLAGKLQVLTDLPLQLGDRLVVDVAMEGQQEPTKALAVVVREEAELEGFHASAIRIVGVNSPLGARA
jgi:hypothetical protein